MKALLALAGVLALTACTEAPPAGPPTVEVADALCRPTPNGRDVTGCYITLTANTGDRLVSVSSPGSATAEIHEMKTENGVMMMAKLTNGLPLPAGEAVRLRPGGNHIMLMGVSAPLRAGDMVSLSLTFEKAGALGVRARVGQPAPAQ